MLMEIIKKRQSIRKFTKEQIQKNDLKKIIEAGIYAPNAGGGQRSMVVAVHNSELTRKIGAMNLSKFNREELAGSYVSKEQPSVIDDPTMKDGFYGAPTVVAIFAQSNFMFRVADAFCMAENMVLQATELGIASCIISRGEETFISVEGQKLLNEWNIPKNYTCQCFVILGILDGENPQIKPRKPGRVKIVE